MVEHIDSSFLYANQAMPIKPLISLALAFLVAGCTVQPTPISSQDVALRVEDDKQRLAAITAPVTQPISIHEAMARALTYNLDLNLERYQLNLAQRQLSLTRHDQLPDIVANHASDGRSNFAGGASRSLITGTQSLESSTSSDRYTKWDDLGLSWDILDFGVSYYRAKQAADRVLLAKEQHRNVVNRILSDVQKAYWRAASYERLIKQLEQLMQKVQSTLADSRQIESQGLDAPLSTLTYQRELINNTRELYRLYEGLTQAKTELAFLMNIPGNEPFELVGYDRPTEIPALPYDLQSMETLALLNRSELMELSYQKRINAHEIRAAYIGMLPGINLNYGRNYNNNSFFFNTDWTDYSARISWNLLDLFRFPDTKRLAQAQSDTLDAQRLALSAVILTQIHVGAARFQHSASEYLIAADLHQTQSKILIQIERAVEADSSNEQALIREEMNALLAEVRYDIAHANLEGALTDLYFAMGLNPVLDELDATSLDTLTRSLEEYFDQQRTMAP